MLPEVEPMSLPEVEVASSFIASFLVDKLPRRKVMIFTEELRKALHEKFAGHWYPESPEKGSGYRCVKVGRHSDQADSVLDVAIFRGGLGVNEVFESMPEELTVWIDPNEVSYKMGDKTRSEILYYVEKKNSDSDSGSGSDDAEVAKTFNGDNQFRSADASGYSGYNAAGYRGEHQYNVSPTMGYRGNGGRYQAPIQQLMSPKPSLNFTPASFAQTKFGSTKLKTTSKRPNRMSPTAFSNYLKQRQGQQAGQQQSMSPVEMQRTASPVIQPPMYGNGMNNNSNSNNSYFFNHGNYMDNFYRNGFANNAATISGGNNGLDLNRNDMQPRYSPWSMDGLASLFDQGLNLTPTWSNQPTQPEAPRQQDAGSYPANSRQQLLLAN